MNDDESDYKSIKKKTHMNDQTGVPEIMAFSVPNLN